MNTRAKAAYGAGAVGKDMVYSLVSGFLLYYYNDVLGVSGTIVGIIFLLARVFDAFNDPLMGVVVEKTHTRFGKFRPWILIGTILNAIILVIVFSVPSNLTMAGKTAFIAVTYVLWGVSYTLMDIPFWSMLPAITSAGKERENVSVIARSCAGFGFAIPTALTVTLVPLLGGGDSLRGYQLWALIIAVLFVLGSSITVRFVKEQHHVSGKTPTVKELIQALIHNDQALVVVVAIIIFNASLYLTQNLALYFFEYDIGNKELFSVFGIVGGGTQILAMMMLPVIRKKFQTFTIFTGAVLTAVVGYGLLLLLGSLHVTNIILLCIAAIIIFFGFGLVTVLTTIFLADTVDYGEYKTGKRNESVIFSLQTFVVKLASAISALIAGVGLDLIHFDKTLETQAQGTLVGLRILMTVVPVVGLVCTIYYFRKKYKLNESKLKEISEKIG